MIKVMLEKQKQFFIILIDDKKVFYWDRLQGQIWGTTLRYLPPDPSNTLKIVNSRNKIPHHFIDLLKVSEEELKEFEDAKDDEKKLLDLVVRDAKKNMCTVIDIKFS